MNGGKKAPVPRFETDADTIKCIIMHLTMYLGC